MYEKAGEKKDRENPVFLLAAAAITWLALLPVRKLPLRPELLALRLGESGGGEQAGDQGGDNFFHDEILGVLSG